MYLNQVYMLIIWSRGFFLHFTCQDYTNHRTEKYCCCCSHVEISAFLTFFPKTPLFCNMNCVFHFPHYPIVPGCFTKGCCCQVKSFPSGEVDIQRGQAWLFSQRLTNLNVYLKWESWLFYYLFPQKQHISYINHNFHTTHSI